jgi:hypothetical protein
MYLFARRGALRGIDSDGVLPLESQLLAVDPPFGVDIGLALTPQCI